jgi:two-component system LytT family response regulator
VNKFWTINMRRIREVQPWFQGSHIVLLQSGEELRMSRYHRDAVERLLGKRT